MANSSGKNPSDMARSHYQKTVSDLSATLAQMDETHLQSLCAMVGAVLKSWQNGGKLMICGNGGSASDSQHIAAELVGRFLADRPGYAALALTTNSSILTAVGNDYGFDHIFSRQVQAMGNPNDVLLVISTSGNSSNCVEAVKEAHKKGIKSFGFLGKGGGQLLDMVEAAMVAPSDQTPRIQEIHIMMGHLLCQLLEEQVSEGD